MTASPRTYIIVEQFSEGKLAGIHDFETIEKAADYMFSAHKDDEIGFVREVNITIRGEHYFLDRTADFIAAWKKREAEELEEEWAEQDSGRENDHFRSRGRLDAYIFSHGNGPVMRKRGIVLEAAE